uniref:Uncharacterized protein n=1 Tax=Myotis myotis TaxID=51298 RepID=A0A7J7ZY09_MYOMY|nr:hypothetical protein mMyoMyo1_009668 [Myotis myotis]
MLRTVPSLHKQRDTGVIRWRKGNSLKSQELERQRLVVGGDSPEGCPFGRVEFENKRLGCTYGLLMKPCVRDVIPASLPSVTECRGSWHPCEKRRRVEHYIQVCSRGELRIPLRLGEHSQGSWELSECPWVLELGFMANLKK